VHGWHFIGHSLGIGDTERVSALLDASAETRELCILPAIWSERRKNYTIMFLKTEKSNDFVLPSFAAALVLASLPMQMWGVSPQASRQRKMANGLTPLPLPEAANICRWIESTHLQSVAGEPF
jgi:hypothetical protein